VGAGPGGQIQVLPLVGRRGGPVVAADAESETRWGGGESSETGGAGGAWEDVILVG